MLQFTCVLKFLMKCTPSSYVLTAQPINHGGLSLSGNTRNVVNTVAMAFVFHGKKLQKTGAWLRLITLHINTVTNTRNKCSGNVARLYSPPCSAWLHCPATLWGAAVISCAYGNQSVKLTTDVDTTVSKSETCESCSGSPPEISL